MKRILWLVTATFFALSMWIWVQKIAVPHQQAESVALDAPRGNLSDLYPRWLGARELLLHHRDPYSAGITREIQIGYYGRPLDPTRPHDPKDQQAFAYPVYVVFLLAPTVGLPFMVVQKIFFWSFLFITAASVWLWMDALAWRTSLTTKVLWILLVLSCFPAIQGIKLRQLSIVVAALLAAFAALLARRCFVWAGILLSFATIKPQLAALPVLWLFIWVLGNWKVRQRAFWSFAVSMAVLVAGGQMLLPGWIGEFRSALGAYYQYTGGGNSVLDVALSPLVGPYRHGPSGCWIPDRGMASPPGVGELVGIPVVACPCLGNHSRCNPDVRSLQSTSASSGVDGHLAFVAMHMGKEQALAFLRGGHSGGRTRAMAERGFSRDCAAVPAGRGRTEGVGLCRSIQVSLFPLTVLALLWISQKLPSAAGA